MDETIRQLIAERGVAGAIEQIIDHVAEELRPRNENWREVTNALREARRVAEIVAAEGSK